MPSGVGSQYPAQLVSGEGDVREERTKESERAGERERVRESEWRRERVRARVKE